MDIKDYSSQLNQARKRYNESSNELKDNFQDRVEELENLHEKRENNQQRNYISQKLDMEAGAERRLKRYDKDLKKSLEERTSRYMKEIGEQREGFEKDRKNQMNNYNQKLEQISNSFDTASLEKDKLHALYKDNINERYDEGLEAREKHFNDSLSKNKKTNEVKMNDFRDEQRLEKRNLVNKFGNEKKQLVQSANIARNKSNSSHQLEMERLRENANQKEATLRNNFESSNSNLRRNKDRENEEQRDTFERLTSDIQERNIAALKKSNRENKMEKRELEEQFSKDRVSLERKTNKLINEQSTNNTDKKLNNLKNRHETRVERLNNQIEENNYRNSLLNIKMSDEQSEELKKLKDRHNNEMVTKENEIRELRQNDVAALKGKIQNYKEVMGKRYKTLELEKDVNILNSRNKLKSTLDRQRTEFGRTINQMNSSNKMVLSNLRDEMTQERSKLIENTKEEVHTKISSMKNDYESKIQKKENAQNLKIELKTKENDLLKKKYELKLSALRQKSAKELEALKKIEQSRREEDLKASNRDLENQRQIFKKDMTAIKREYDRKLDRSKTNADIHIAKLTQRYEDLIETERSEHSRELQRSNDLMKNKLSTLFNRTKLEKDSMISQYELKLSKLRDANRAAQALEDIRSQNKA